MGTLASPIVTAVSALRKQSKVTSFGSEAARLRANEKRLGRLRRDTDSLFTANVVRMRAKGRSWAKMEADTGIPTGSLRRLAKMSSSGSV